MSLTDLLPRLQALSRGEKLAVIRMLAVELETGEDALRQIAESGSFPVWSPYDSLEAAASLQRMLDQAGVEP